MKWIIPFVLFSHPAVAAGCPPVADRSDDLARITSQLSMSEREQDARPLTEQLWLIWRDAPDAKAQALLDRGAGQILDSDYLGARDTFDALVEYCPDYAEGYNQRAFASYLRRDFSAALFDLDKALEILPNHVAALAGRGLTLLGLGRNVEAQDALRAAVALNPWLAERRLITEPDGIEL